MLEIKIPSLGESITEVTLSSWMVSDGDYVEEGESLCEIESDKASVELPAESSGVIKILVEDGAELEVGAVIASLDTSAAKKSASAKPKAKAEEKVPEVPSESTSSGGSSQKKVDHASPAARKILTEKGIDPSSVSGTGKDGRVTKADALSANESKGAQVAISEESSDSFGGFSRNIRREKMTRLRKTIANRLVQAKSETAMLTTFNEVDMFEVMALRKRYKEAFKKKHDVGLGFMSLFTKACTIALRDFPGVNAQIDGGEMIFHDYADIGIAVSTPKGLVVPVVRNAESKPLHQIEKDIISLATKAREGKLSIDEMQGGTFTITNGGVFGSMLSTPIINIPQSAILGMHNIVERPIALNGQVVIRPVMYLALSYDHRVIDGRESVSFLKAVKELLEDPARMLLDI